MNKSVIFKSVELNDFKVIWECSGCSARYYNNHITLSYQVCPDCGNPIESFEDEVAETIGV